MFNTLYLASDHAGYALKEQLKPYLVTQFPEIAIHDLGTTSEESVDYPDFGKQAAQAVSDTLQAGGIIVCGSGIGISIAANRISGARAALCVTPEMAALSREHNDANILALGARLISEDTAYACIKAFLTTEFAAGRHQARVEKLG